MGMHRLFCRACKYEKARIGTLPDDIGACPECGEWRRYGTAGFGRKTTKAYDVPIEMHSIAPVTDQEIHEFRERHPTVEMTPDGTPLARTREEKLRILKAEGFEERN